MSDSGKDSVTARSPAVPLPSSMDVLSERTRDLRHSLFGSDDEYGGGYDYSSPRSIRASSHERVDDGARRRYT